MCIQNQYVMNLQPDIVKKNAENLNIIKDKIKSYGEFYDFKTKIIEEYHLLEILSWIIGIIIAFIPIFSLEFNFLYIFAWIIISIPALLTSFFLVILKGDIRTIRKEEYKKAIKSKIDQFLTSLSEVMTLIKNNQFKDKI